MRVLVTGASGLIGSHAVNELAEAGHEVVPVIRDGRAGKTGPALRIDLADPEATARLAELDFDAIVHCAAVLPGMNGQTAEVAAAINSTIDAAVLGAARKRAVPMVYPSGTSVYGAAPGPWREDTPPAPQNAYSAGKLAGEAAFLADLEHAVVLRISSPYGPGQRARNVLRLFIEKALAGETVSYHGSGARTQDFVAAEDVARAIRLALEARPMREIFNIASGKPVAMRDLALLVARIAGGPEVKAVASGESDPQEDYRAEISIGKAAALLGWKPQISLAEGVRALAASLSVHSC